ncbi:hypothetical protein TIFTF001_017455 [Ficus carica]|uniref:Uncharacterized protein n=1 Tax=Ficus carica TaxID=3494 RepID=A0AA88D8B9_FICCA|nr:hypothetical protein TIFTF001_017455 [Ficus carica]
MATRPIPHGVKLHAMVDASHSGRVFPTHLGNRRGQYQCRRSGVRKGTSGGEAICFGGCDDDQESADTSAVSNGKPSGAMTASFIRAIDRGQGSTYGSILSSMRSTVRNSDNVNSII